MTGKETKSKDKRVSYNGDPLREGEVLVPMLVDSPEYAESIGAKQTYMRTWSKAGIPFRVMFVPVPEAYEKICWQNFQAAVNEFLEEKLGPNRHARCLVPNPDGSLRVCPKVRDHNHPPCAECPNRGKYLREDRSTIPLSELDEEKDPPVAKVFSAESGALEKLLLEDLLEELGKINPVLADVVSLGYQGFERKEIIRQLPVKPSRGYEIYSKAKELTREYLRS